MIGRLLLGLAAVLSLGTRLQASERLLAQHCLRCHASAEAVSGIDLSVSFRELVDQGYVDAVSPEQSLLYQVVARDEMPRGQLKLSAAEKALFLAWIKASLEDLHAPRPVAPWIDDVEQVITQDLASLPVAARASARYVVASHLELNDQGLASMRKAIGLSINSVSWSAALHAPVQLGGGVYRIGLGELGWTARTWTRIDSVYPFAAERSATAGDWVRADWLIYSLALAPLYYDVLGLPVTRAGFESLLGVDRTRLPLRSGFLNSGVTQFNRVLERSPTPYGAYWKSYDFNIDPSAFITPGLQALKPFKNIVDYPLRPGDVPGQTTGFLHDGEEAIFHLANGLLGYYVSNFNQARLELVPIQIAQDLEHSNRAVTTAISCMRCHSDGIIQRRDEMRAQAAHLDDARRAKVLALYPPENVFIDAVKQDNARLRVALDGLGVRDQRPVTTWHDRYAQPLGARQVLAELSYGGPIARLIACSPELGRFARVQDGGQMARQTFEQIFATVRREVTSCEFRATR